MKKFLAVITAVAIFMTALTTVLGDDDVTVLLDGTKLEFDVPPQIINDRTMVPMRAIFEALGADVVWNGDTRTITSTKDDTEIIMMIGYSTMYVNLDTVELDTAPVIIGDRTLVPLRAVAESFDCKVDWEDETRTVTILTGEVLSPSPSPSPSPSASPSPDPDVSASPSPTASATPSGSSASSPSGSKEADSASPSPSAQVSDDGTDITGPTSSPEATEAPEEAETPEETTEPDGEENGGSGTSSADKYNIEYDRTNEHNASYANNFQIIEITENDEGDYDIVYTVQTYRDDSGNIALTFNCYDEDGDRIGSFSEIFHTWAYSWTEQEANATIPWGTVRIELELVNN